MKKAPYFPSKEEITAFISQAGGELSYQEVVRAFGLKNKDRSRLRLWLKELEKEGKISPKGKILSRERGAGKRASPKVPPVLRAVIYEATEEGEWVAHPQENNQNGIRIYLLKEGAFKEKYAHLHIGDEVLVKVKALPKSPHCYGGHILRSLKKSAISSSLLGVVQKEPRGYTLFPIDRRLTKSFPVLVSPSLSLKKGDFVKGILRGNLFQVEKVLASEHDPHFFSTIAVHAYGLKDSFSPSALKKAQQAQVPPKAHREDLREIPLVTIDGEEARDFDDAVFAEPDPQGWHLIVAIADVAHYVSVGDALDKEAFERGNSTYFPDRVLPMLPEALSKGVCSLQPEVERACLAVHLWISPQGILKKHHFVRGLMRSKARLTYTDVQKALDGHETAYSKEFVGTILTPLYQAYLCLKKAREKRGALDFDRHEPKIHLDAKGMPIEVKSLERLEAHRLIEEFMITANVAAAQTLEEKKAPCLYRVHESPDPLKIETLREALKAFRIPLAKGHVIHPKLFKSILEKAKGSKGEHVIQELVLRTQTRAFYAPKSLGHFGLNLPRYAHFTSPIRRYADLMVHRSLITQLGLGDGGFPTSPSHEHLEEISLHISNTERVSDQAVWESVDRFMALYFMDSLHHIFRGRIDGVSGSGLFIKLEGLPVRSPERQGKETPSVSSSVPSEGYTGATGFLPLRFLQDDYYNHEPLHHRLVGRRSGSVYALGDTLEVRLREANPLTGSLILSLSESSSPPKSSKLRRGKRK